MKVLRVRVKGRWYTVKVADMESSPIQVLVDGDAVEVEVPQSAEAPPNAPDDEPFAPLEQATRENRGPAVAKVFNSPMPGIIISVAVSPGDTLVTGDEICVLEAMKMQQTLRADWSGIVGKVHVAPGQQVLDGAPIVELA